MKKLVLAALATLLVGMGAAFAQVVVHTAPPPPVVQARPVTPGPRYVWVSGYYRWDGRRYVWVAGRWVMPPHPGGVWVSGYWVARNGGWAWVPGRWHY